MSNRTLSGTTIPDYSGPWSNGNEGVVCIPTRSKTGASPLDCLMLYPEHTLGEIQSVYSTPTAKWAVLERNT